MKGEPGKGKTMLLCGIIDHLAKITSAEEVAISFFFCQGTDGGLNNAIAVLRDLIYVLLTTHPHLLSHIRKRYDNAGKQLHYH